jgi:hypothetical protein
MSKVSEREKLQRDIGSLVDELSKLRAKLDQLDPKPKNKRVGGDILFPWATLGAVRHQRPCANCIGSTD